MVHCRNKWPSYEVTPVAAGGRVYHLGTTGRLCCLDLATGKPLWESDVGDGHKRMEEMKAKNLTEALRLRSGRVARWA